MGPVAATGATGEEPARSHSLFGHQMGEREGCLAAHFAQLNVAEARWDALSDTERFGLTFKDFSIFKDKYGIVATVQIVKEVRYVGCLTLSMLRLVEGP